MEGGNTGAGHGKRTTFRRMNQMNEDFLPLLKKPLCSELSRQVVGHNAGQRAQCQRRLDLWFKERNIVLEKMRRSQVKIIFHTTPHSNYFVRNLPYNTII